MAASLGNVYTRFYRSTHLLLLHKSRSPLVVLINTSICELNVRAYNDNISCKPIGAKKLRKPTMFIVRRHFRLIRSFEDIWFWPVTIRTYTTDFYLFQCTNTGVIATHALSFYRLLAPLSCWLVCSSLLWLRAAPYCTLLRTVTYCCSDAIVLVTPIVRVTLLFSYST